MTMAKKNCCIWTRVSTKYQEDNGGSLQTQKEKCEAFAKANGYKIVENGYFGGAHESSKTPGPLIKSMMSELKKRKNTVNTLIVSQVDRFSRNAAQGIQMFSDLLAIGVTIVEAESGMRTDDPNQLLMLQIRLCMAQWDNHNRTDKFQQGIKACLESGIYFGALPIGYKRTGKSRNTIYEFDENAPLVKKAFQWKLQGMANCQILEKLRPLGLDLTKQKLHKILTNVFYTGKFRHKKLGKELKDGNHPALISYADFLKVQDILSGRTGVYHHKKETPQFPLKRHVLCAHDHLPLTAYTVKKKGIDYYKCNKDGCKTNVSAKKLHAKYEALLRSYDIPQPLVNIVREYISDLICADQSENKKIVASLRKRKTEKEKDMKTCKVNRGLGKIDEDIYETTVAVLQSEIDEITLELSKYDSEVSNLDKSIGNILVMCCHLDTMWRESSIEAKQKLQNLLFPEGILWDKEIDDYRTIKENEALAVLRKISASYRKEKEENPEGNSSGVNSCARGDSNSHVRRHQILSLARLPLRHARRFTLQSYEINQKLKTKTPKIHSPLPSSFEV